MLGDPAFLGQLMPYLGRKEEMGGVVAVQVSDLAARDLEGKLAGGRGRRLRLARW